MLINNNKKKSTIILSVLFIILYGSGFVAIKLGFPFASPLTLLTYRSLILIVIFLILSWVMKASWPENWRQVGHIAVSGFFLTALFSLGTWTSIAMGATRNFRTNYCFATFDGIACFVFSI